MRATTRKATTWGLALLIALAAHETGAGRLYKWVDEEGNVHYGDTVPPEYADRERRVINERGVTLGVTEAAKSAEQRAEEERQARIREQQRRVAEKRAARDRILLQTFSNVDDMHLTRDGKIAAIEAVIRITRSNINGLRQALDQLTRRAAGHERAGRRVPDELRREIEAVQRQIETNEAFIEARRAEQDEVRAKFDADIKRFLELHAAMALERRQRTAAEARGQEPVDQDRLGRSTITCRDFVDCQKAWSLAQSFVHGNATVRIQMVTDTLIMTFEPKRAEDVGMTIARYPESGESARLVMDLVCHDSPEGRRLCRSDEVQALKAAFVDYIQSHLR
jgi:hypothetical protein